jgi:uncharacterized protein YdcH (DUF465 family)
LFTKHLELINTLNASTPAFAYLYKKYVQLEEQIALLESDKAIGGELFCPKNYQKLKHEKRALHQEIYLIIRKIDNRRVTRRLPLKKPEIQPTSPKNQIRQSKTS